MRLLIFFLIQAGSRWEYSNSNYILLSMLIKKITGPNAIEEVQRRIFVPLELHHTYFPGNQLKTMPGVNPSDIVHGYAFYPKGRMPYSLDGYQFYYFYNPRTRMYWTFGINTRSDVVEKNNTMAVFNALNAECKE